MILRSRHLAAALATALLGGVAAAAGLTPLVKDGLTPSAAKAFHVTALNPYDRPVRFVLEVMEPDLVTRAAAARVAPAEVVIPPKGGRQVMLVFDVPPNVMERSVALCISAPEVGGTVLARVCGRYTGRKR
jgi:hypothetical protein